MSLTVLPYHELLQRERELADLESKSLLSVFALNKPPNPNLDLTPAWILWKTVCSCHDELLDELDRRELHYQDG